jgi:PAS domain S-box-containing protein
MAMDADTGRFIEVNENAVRLFGRPRAELFCLGPEALSPATQPDGRSSAEVAKEKVGEALAGGRPVFEWTHRNANGDRIPCEVRLARFPASGRNLAIGTITDITDRKRAEAETLKTLAREKELNALKSNFVQIVSHEFRTPLGVILSSADLLDVYLDRLDERERRETVALIQKSTRHMASLMENVLVLSKADAGKMAFEPAQINFPDFCRRLADEILTVTHHKCPIIFDATELNGGAWGDERLLRHIFLNLLSNAVKYSDEGRPVHFTVTNEADTAVCQISDQGIGIPMADQDRLFSAFHRGRNVEHVAGTGLGLLIVKRCVELHGGRVTCESNEGSGTTFTVRLPLYPKP